MDKGNAAGGRAANLLLGLLIALGLIEVSVAAATHRRIGDWRRLWHQGAAADRVLALQVLINHSEQPVLGDELVRELLASDEPLLRELAFHCSITRLRESETLREFLSTSAGEGERIRGEFLLEFQPAGPSKRTEMNEDLQIYLDTLE